MSQTEHEQSPAVKSAERETWNYLYLVMKNRGGSNGQATRYANQGGGSPDANTNPTEEHKTEEHKRAKTGEEKSDAEYVAEYKLKFGEGIFRDPFDGIVIPLFIIWNMLAPLVLIASIAMFFGPGWFLGLFYILVWCELEPGFSEEWRGARHHRSLDEYRISVMKFREDKAIKEQKRRAEAPRFTPPINMEQKRPYCGHAGYEY